ncbi:radical SAM protein [Dactylosporangium matsuzakiense]|uniref:Radical SAM protein n=1 Tax=Dactylosporangium matsuzakiense TaxID=53360 RepID=A0A9W6KWE6_9ACTN|nr:radical SAM protein [Dactylosporangium matsuzakiense]UWZ47910.1 4Fe-4S cluster-binding domain-containing protein [Dactylosporangium matsuzakiense]GLL08553.1 radical SAM protein [Dactylosporangium matsuzakiense]
MALTASLLIHAVVARSRANGPGERMTVWVQGCSLGCAGCFNPGTHAAGSARRTVAQLLTVAAAEPIEGVTLTGGEPLEQPDGVAALGAGLRRAGLGLIILTGYSRREIEADPARLRAVAAADLVVAGRYQRKAHLGGALRGSANKTYWWRTERYRHSDLDGVPDLEVIVGADGTMTITGMTAPTIG